MTKINENSIPYRIYCDSDGCDNSLTMYDHFYKLPTHDAIKAGWKYETNGVCCCDKCLAKTKDESHES